MQGCPARSKAIERVLQTSNDAVQCLDQTAAADSVMPIAQKVRDYVYIGIDDAGHYANLLGTQHFDPFVKHMLYKNRIAGLLAATLQAGRVEDAVRLVQQLHHVHPIAGADDATQGESGGKGGRFFPDLRPNVPAGKRRRGGGLWYLGSMLVTWGLSLSHWLLCYPDH